jgi:hypothetical protein
MRPINGTLLQRSDLSKEYIETSFNEIHALMFGIVKNKFTFNDDILIFMDDDGKTKIIKNRFGNGDLT